MRKPRLPSTINVVAAEKPVRPSGQLSFEIRPPGERPWILDLQPFSRGDPATDLPPIPKLIEELAPTVFASVSDKSELSGRVFLDALRSFWRCLRDNERGGAKPPAQLSEVDATTGAFYRLWLLRTQGLKMSTASTYYNRVRGLVSKAAESAGPNSARLTWPRLTRDYEPEHRDIDPQILKPLYSKLKAVHQKALKSWRETAEVVEGKRHSKSAGEIIALNAALDRVLVDSIVDPTVSLSEAIAVAAPSLVKDTRHRVKAAAGLVPDGRDMSAAFYLVLMHTGWNPEAVENIDVSSDAEWMDPRLAGSHEEPGSSVAIYGFKNKVDREQIAFSLTKPQGHPYQVIKSQIARTTRLREHLRQRLAVLAKLEAPTWEQERAIVDLRRMIRSPWLYLKRTCSPVSGYVACLEKSSFQNTMLTNFAAEALKHLEERGVSESVLQLHEPLRRLRPSDFRDGFAAHIFEEGQFNLLLVQSALNHRRLSSTQAYIRQRRQLMARMQEFGRLQEAIFAELPVGGIDPTFILLRLRPEELTAEQRDRVIAHRARTRMGTGCLDPRNPPPTITEERGVCAVQRCTICRHAVVFQDSLPALARRQAELQCIRAETPYERFEASSFRLEWEALSELRLKLGPADSAEFDACVEGHRARLQRGEAYLFDQMPVRRAP